ncbi:hypothetical protein [Brachyspira alvinipulli]|uniref:hypothetical protein n=1 Tax=Brachyspira alvinipulli TaxID=84379 RepID=UPI0004B4D7AA|nr:hypothetical protein [Brachyspira alvinipulli]
MKVDYSLIKDILQFLNDKETCIINGYELSRYFSIHVLYIPKGLSKPTQEELENKKK